MGLLSISAAARAAGKDRGTIQRYIKSGKLSTTKDAAGNTKIDPAELLRVFGELKTSGSSTPAVQDAPEPQYTAEVFEALQQMLRVAQERENRLLDMLAQEQQSRRELEQRMLPAIEQQPKKSFWKQLFGR